MVRAIDKAWRAVRRDRLKVRRLGAEFVVYDDDSGNTHLLDSLSGAVLERLLASSATFDELVPLADGDRAGSPVSPHFALSDVLARLRRLGIVKPLRK